MKNSEKFLYVVAGTGIGAVLGILFAPKRGADLRNDIASQAQRGVELITETVGEGKKFVREQSATATGTVRNIVERGKQQFNESIEGVKNRLNDSIEVGRQEYENLRREPKERGGAL